MKLEFPYKEGDLVTIYDNHQHEAGPLGTARLVKLHRPGRSFILEETMPESEQIVYNYQEWFVDWVDNPTNVLETKPVKIRYIDTIGIANSADDEDADSDLNNLPVDSFLTINGIEIY